MARLIFECLDADGQHVLFATSEKGGQELVEGYVPSRQWLQDHGFTPVNAPGPRPRCKEPVPFDGRPQGG